MKTNIYLTASALLLSAAVPMTARAQIAVSANDGKQPRPGEAASARTADTISIIDMRRYPPRTLAMIEAPASMIGPPHAVAVARGGRFALVSAAQRLNAAGEIQPNDGVSLVDLSKPDAPKVVQTVHAGPGASGVSINRAGTLALVASTDDDIISIFSIAGGRLTPAGKLQLPAKTRPTDVAFAPDGKSALAVGQGANKLIHLAVTGDKVVATGREITPGRQPYGVVFSADGRYAYNTNLGGNLPPPDAPPVAPGTPREGTVSAIDLATNRVTSIEVGQTPEHLVLSPDGAYMAVVLINGSNATPSAPGYNPHGFLRVYSVRGDALTLVAETRTGAWCQGATFSDDGRALLLQCAMEKEIEVYRFDGKTLTRDPSATLRFTARPGAIATATSR